MQEISLDILDIAQNSISACATLIEITVDENSKDDTLTVAISDNGLGMTSEQLKAVTDPFYTTRKTRKVGLGVPFFKMAAEMSGGNFKISSEVGKGTKVCGIFGLSNIDRMPLGNINETISALIYCNPDIDFVYKRSRNGKSFTLDTQEIRKKLGEDIPINVNEVSVFIKEFLRENENDITKE